MPRGRNRFDVPVTTRGVWRNPDGPAPGWEDWEERFNKKFSAAFREEVINVLWDSQGYLTSYGEPERYAPRGRVMTGVRMKDASLPRLDAKQIKRYLDKTEKTGAYPHTIARLWVENLYIGPPDVGISEKANSVLHDFENNPSDFLMERRAPEPLFTGFLFDLFEKAGFDVSRGSKSALEGADSATP